MGRFGIEPGGRNSARERDSEKESAHASERDGGRERERERENKREREVERQRENERGRERGRERGGEREKREVPKRVSDGRAGSVPFGLPRRLLSPTYQPSTLDCSGFDFEFKLLNFEFKSKKFINFL